MTDEPNPYPSHLGPGVPFYRCDACRRIVAPWDIEAGGCRCGARKIRPADPTRWEMLGPHLRRPRDWKRFHHDDG